MKNVVFEDGTMTEYNRSRNKFTVNWKYKFESHSAVLRLYVHQLSIKVKKLNDIQGEVYFKRYLLTNRFSGGPPPPSL